LVDHTSFKLEVDLKGCEQGSEIRQSITPGSGLLKKIERLFKGRERSYSYAKSGKFQPITNDKREIQF